MRIVLKYGGSALASASHLEHLVVQVQSAWHQEDAPPLVVVSAMAGSTRHLQTLARLVREGHTDQAMSLLERLKHIHQTRAKETIADPERLHRLLETLETSCWELAQEIRQLGQLPYGSAAVPWQITRVICWGDHLAVLLVAAALQDVGLCAQAVTDAVIQTTQPSTDTPSDGLLCAQPLLEETRQRAYPLLLPLLGARCIPVVAGGLAQTPRGGWTSLGPQGSDLAAAVLAVALHAQKLLLFTRADGILSADPCLVPDAYPLRTLEAQEALALLTPGTSPVHPQVIALLAAAHLPLWIRSLMAPDAPGTRIIAATHPSHLTGALALSPAVALLTFRALFPSDSSEPLVRLLRLISQMGVAPLLITLTASTHLGIVLDEHAVEAALATCAQAADGWIIECQRGLAACHGIGRIFGQDPHMRAEAVLALRKAGIEVVGDGCSEQGMMLLVQASDGARALRVLHRALLPSPGAPHQEMRGQRLHRGREGKD